MRCSQCQREAIAGAVFCHHCGLRLQERCKSCSTLNSLGSNFCLNCGAQLGSDAGLKQERANLVGDEARSSASAAVCPRCRAVNEPGSAHCFQCGLPLEDTPSSVYVSSMGGAGAYIGEPAGFWIRFAAYLIDSLVLLVPLLILLAFLGVDSSSDVSATEGLTWTDYLALALAGLYFTVTVGAWRTTIGKRVLRLYIVRSDGSRVGFGRSLARYLSYFISSFILLLGFVMIGLRRDKRGLHDLICDTRVVRK